LTSQLTVVPSRAWTIANAKAHLGQAERSARGSLERKGGGVAIIGGSKT
jgi:hypothetical protein